MCKIPGLRKRRIKRGKATTVHWYTGHLSQCSSKLHTANDLITEDIGMRILDDPQRDYNR